MLHHWSQSDTHISTSFKFSEAQLPKRNRVSAVHFIAARINKKKLPHTTTQTLYCQMWCLGHIFATHSVRVPSHIFMHLAQKATIYTGQTHQLDHSRSSILGSVASRWGSAYYYIIMLALNLKVLKKKWPKTVKIAIFDPHFYLTPRLQSRGPTHISISLILL